MDESFRQRLKTLGSAHEEPWIKEHLKNKNLETDHSAWNQIVSRREAHEPLAYIFGSWVFRSLELAVGPGVLIPRPETEELVDMLLKHKSHFTGRPVLNVVDMGAGSGCLGLGLEHEFKTLGVAMNLDLVERSELAWPWIEKNIQATGSKAQLVKSDWNHYQRRTDILLSNPPYLSEQDFLEVEKGVSDFEPRSALTPDDLNQHQDASGPYRFLLGWAQKHLNAGGYFCFELGLHQGPTMLNLTRDLGFQNSALLVDMAGKVRFLEGFQNG